MDGPAHCRAQRSSYPEKQNRTAVRGVVAELSQDRADLRIGGIGSNQLAEFARLLAALNLENLGSVGRKQFRGRLDA
jgi:hypothetical protein